MPVWRPLGAILQEEFDVPAELIEQALAEQRANEQRLGETLLVLGAVTPHILNKALALQFRLPFLERLPVEQADPELLDAIPLAFAKEHRFFPLKREGNMLRVAIANPLNTQAVNDLVALTGCYVDLAMANTDTILEALNRAYQKQHGGAEEMVQEFGPSQAEELAATLEPSDLLDSSDEAPIIRFVNSLILQAAKERASDIHIEPYERELVVRYRIDGILYEILKPPLKAHAGIVSRIKIMSGLDIAERRLPQDGRFRVRIAGRNVDVRVSTLPTGFGERLVLRLLDKAASILTLEEIGMPAALLRQSDGLIRRSHGIYLVTGPTGSGKTTTLYAVLSRLNDHKKNIITVEDPIEYQLEGVGQIQVNPKIDLTFASGLRSILRQDPDIIMVGEIRDGETAEIAVQSAMTGHMVFSTLHTNSAAGALTRLVEMGVEPFLLASSVVGVMAQRLVRTLCPHCREAFQPSVKLLERLELLDQVHPGTPFYRPRGCDHCMNIGFQGRTGVYELMPMDESVRKLLLSNQDSATLEAAAVSKGMTTLRQAGLQLVVEGKTTLSEIFRVTQEVE